MALDKNRFVKQQSYRMIHNLKFHMLSAKKWDKKLFYYQFWAVLPSVISGYIGALIPSEIVRTLEEKKSMAVMIGTIIMLVFIMLVCDILYKSMSQYLYRNSMSLTLYYDKLCFEKMMRIDYDRIEEPENQRLIGNTWNILKNEFAIRNSVTGMPQLFIATFGSLWYGTVVAIKNPLIILFLMTSSIVSFVLLTMIRKMHEKKSQELGAYAKEAAYVSRQAMERSSGKDIRLYQMQNWILGKYNAAIKAMDNIYDYIHKHYFGRWVVENIMKYVTELLSYGYLLYLLLQGDITASTFVLYVGLITAFSNHFIMLIQGIMELNPVNISIRYIRQFLDMEECRERGKGIGSKCLEEMKKTGVKVELRHVSFTYPGKNLPTLSDVNLVIQPNEKIALIGLNGAGKTTLVKLLCGFYQPTEGEILINNIPAKDYTREEYGELVSVLFQDSTFLPITLDENLTGQQEESIDKEQLQKVLELSGFISKYEVLPKKGQTLLVRETNEEATDFSGGEKQKFLFARALYKKAPLLILDEPTAALDPIAENELYQKYGDASKNRTSVYISHRLSSTRFCDRIILLEDAKILEDGTHEELMKKQGRYASLYEIQSQYYRNENEKKEMGQ